MNEKTVNISTAKNPIVVPERLLFNENTKTVAGYDLDSLRHLIYSQARTKGWRTDSKYCLKRALKELLELWDELDKAVLDQEKISLEVIDVLYFILQISKDAAPEFSIKESFVTKYNDNWVTQKKTEDAKGNQVLK